jgi:hypothetical protein
LSPLVCYRTVIFQKPTAESGVYDRAQRGWRLTCTEQRRRLARLLRRSPSLQPTAPAEVAEAYEVARLQATAALQVDETRMPAQCAWSVEQVLDEAFWPEGEPKP